LTLEVFVAVETQLGAIGEVRAVLEEERPEVGVDGVEVIDFFGNSIIAAC
jgi:hypothetical protein